MDTNPECEPVDLANNECCGITLCPQCQVIHLRIGPVTLKLPPKAFQIVCGAVRQAAEILPAHLPGEAKAVSNCQGTRH